MIASQFKGVVVWLLLAAARVSFLIGEQLDGVAVNYATRAQQADELDRVELKVRLEEMAADEAEHARTA